MSYKVNNKNNKNSNQENKKWTKNPNQYNLNNSKKELIVQIKHKI